MCEQYAHRWCHARLPSHLYRATNLRNAALSEEVAAGAWREGQAVSPEEAQRVASASLAENRLPTDSASPARPRRIR
jgi:hypothetical protein